MAKIEEIADARITSGEYHVRASLEDDGIDELSRSIAKLGLLVPLLVKENGGMYVVIAGHRRLAACRKIGMTKIKCVVVAGKDEYARSMSFAENMFRRDLTPIEEAAAVGDLVSQRKMTIEAVASLVQRSCEWVQGRLMLLDWPDEVQGAVHSGVISAAAAKNIAAVDDNAYRGILLQQAAESGATARTTAAWLQAWRAAKPSDEALRSEPLPGRPHTQPATLMVACVVCNEKHDASRLAYLPICPGCVETISGAVGSGR